MRMGTNANRPKLHSDCGCNGGAYNRCSVARHRRADEPARERRLREASPVLDRSNAHGPGRSLSGKAIQFTQRPRVPFGRHAVVHGSAVGAREADRGARARRPLRLPRRSRGRRSHRVARHRHAERDRALTRRARPVRLRHRRAPAPRDPGSARRDGRRNSAKARRKESRRRRRRTAPSSGPI